MKSLQRALVGLLSVLAVWPAVQWYLVERYDVNPWKLCGFAMYCTPQRLIVDFVDTTHGRRTIPSTQIEESLGVEYAEFVEWRHQLGTLWSPDTMARSVLGSFPEVQSLRVEIHLMRLDPHTATLKVRTRSYDYNNTDSQSAPVSQNS